MHRQKLSQVARERAERIEAAERSGDPLFVMVTSMGYVPQSTIEAPAPAVKPVAQERKLSNKQLILLSAAGVLGFMGLSGAVDYAADKLSGNMPNLVQPQMDCVNEIGGFTLDTDPATQPNITDAAVSPYLAACELANNDPIKAQSYLPAILGSADN
jgi:hypothetical protein